MSPTTADKIEGIIDVQDGADLQPFIDSAYILVSRVCGASTYAEDQFEMIQRWLAAHFYAIFDAQVVKAKAGSAFVEFQEKIDYGLKLTHWGQQAIMMDTDLNLAALSNASVSKKKIKFGIIWMGIPRCQRLCNG